MNTNKKISSDDTNESIAQKMTLMQDRFMRVVFEDRACVEAVIRDIFDDQSIRLLKSFPQSQLNNLFGKEVRMDALAIDDMHIFYNIEPQEKLSEARPERARYYVSMIDTKILDHGDQYTSLPKLYVIFITDGDMFKHGEPVYTIPRIVHPNGSQFPDGSCIMYLNSRIQNTETSLGRLMHDFTTANPDEIYNPVLRERIRKVKKIGEDGKSYMCKVIDDLLEEREAIARRDEKENNSREIAMRMHECGLSDEMIAKCVNETSDKVKAWFR